MDFSLMAKFFENSTKEIIAGGFMRYFQVNFSWDYLNEYIIIEVQKFLWKSGDPPQIWFYGRTTESR